MCIRTCMTCIDFCMGSLVSDFTLSCHSADELQECQRRFVQTMVSQPSKTQSKDAKKYFENLLSQHVRAAIVLPLNTDALAQGWVLVDNEVIKDQIFNGIGDMKRIVELAQWFQTQPGGNQHLSSAIIYGKLAMRDRKNDKVVCCAHSRNALDALRHAASTHINSLKVELFARRCLMECTFDEQERDKQFDLTLKCVTENQDRLELTGEAGIRAQHGVGCTMQGFFSGHK